MSSFVEVVRHTLLNNPDRVTDENFMKTALDRISFKMFIDEIKNYPYLYDTISKKQSFWKEYYQRHQGSNPLKNFREGVSEQNVNWFYENFMFMKYYYNYDNIKSQPTALSRSLHKYVNPEELKLHSENVLLSISDIKDIIILYTTTYFLSNNGDLTELKSNGSRQVIMKNIDKMIFRTSSIFGGGRGFLILLDKNGELWKYGLISYLRIDEEPDENKKYFMTYKLNVDIDDVENVKVIDIKIVGNTETYFTLFKGDEILIVFSLEQNDSFDIIAYFPITFLTSPVYTVWYSEPRSLFFAAAYNNNPLNINSGFLQFFTINPYPDDKYIGFEFPVDLGIQDLNIVKTRNTTSLQMKTKSKESGKPGEYYWIDFNPLLSINKKIFKDLLKEYIENVEKEIGPRLTNESLKSDKVVVNKRDIKNIISRNTDNYSSEIKGDLYAVDTEDFLYTFSSASGQSTIGIRFGEFGTLYNTTYESNYVPGLNRVFIAPFTGMICGEVLEVYSSVIIHKLHFIYNSAKNNIKNEIWSSDETVVMYSLRDSPYTFETTF